MRDPCFLSREKFHHLGPVGTEAALNNLGEKKAIMSEIADFRFGIKKMTHTSVHVIFLTQLRQAVQRREPEQLLLPG